MGNTLNNRSTLQGGKYTILKVLGQGGFGITYLAKQRDLKNYFAIKEFFLYELCGRDSKGVVTTLTQGKMVGRYRKKFLKEAQILANLHHPGMVRVSDYFEENGTAYYVMDYIDGESLEEKVRREGTLPEPVALRYISKVASALDYIHRSKVNHLDLKPSNIMVRRADDEPVLIDFGVSKQYDEQKNQTTTTPPGVSDGYSPLEQYKPGGVSTFSPQADIYSLGATFYKLLTGNTPPNANDILNDGHPSLPSSISPQVRAAIGKAMQPRLMDRPDSVGEWLGMMGLASTVTGGSDDTQTIGIEENHGDKEGTLILEKDDPGQEKSEVTLPINDKRTPKPSSKSKRNIFSKIGTSLQRFRKPLEISVFGILATLIVMSLLDKFLPYSHDEDNDFKETVLSGNIEEIDSAAEAVLEDPDLAAAAVEEAYESDETVEATKKNAFCPDGNHPHAIDLGLPSGTKWACCNVGATTPEGYGGYYAWGETETKSTYDWSTYKHCEGTKESCRNIGSDIAGTQYDVAHVKWGGSWRMPSKDQVKELLDNCSSVWTTFNGVKGRKFTSKKNGKSVFLPAAGDRWDDGLYYAGSYGSYWSSTQNPSVTSYAYDLGVASVKADWYNYGRGYGHTVRPVSR